MYSFTTNMHIFVLVGLSKFLTAWEKGSQKGITRWDFGSQNHIPDVNLAFKSLTGRESGHQIFLPDTIFLTGKIYDYFVMHRVGRVQNWLRNMCTLPKPWSMSARLRRSKFLFSPACIINWDRDIPGAETLYSCQGQQQTFILKYKNFR